MHHHPAGMGDAERGSPFARLHELQADALMVVQDIFFNAQSERLASLCVRHATPAIYVDREFAAAGGLMSLSARVQCR